MKVVLINPLPEKSNIPFPALSLSYLSSFLKANNHEALILDLCAEPLSDYALRKKILEYNPDLIGITFFTRRYVTVKELANKLKSWFPTIKIIVGGSHPSALPREVLQEIDSIDLVAIGEGENTIVDVVESLKSDRLDHIKGIAFRKRDEIIINPPREYIENLDTLPFPDLEQVDSSKYKIHPPYGWYGIPLTMVTTRGCPGRCIFCSKAVFKNTLRSMSPDRIIEEIKYWKGRLPIREIRFFDDDFTILEKRTFDICDLLIKERINLPWTCTTRVDFLTRELLVKMKKAGLYFIVLGVESGSPRVLKSLRKGYTVEHIRNAFKWCHELKITTFAFFMVGNPDETDEDIKMGLQLQKEIRANFLSWGVLRTLPGSTLFERCKDKYDFTSDKEYPYFSIYRKDLDENVLYNFCRRAMFKHYRSYVGVKSVLTYFYKTRNWGAIRDYIQWTTEKL
ncbi:MAG: radical SAM protein [Pseudomonadota bacterium]